MHTNDIINVIILIITSNIKLEDVLEKLIKRNTEKIVNKFSNKKISEKKNKIINIDIFGLRLN